MKKVFLCIALSLLGLFLCFPQLSAEQSEKLSQEQPLKSLKEAVENSPQSSEAYYALTIGYLEQGKLENAFKSILKAVELVQKKDVQVQHLSSFSEDDKKLYDEVLVMLNKRQEDDAQEILSSLKEKYPYSPEILYNLAIIHGNAGDYGRFFDYFYQGAQLDKTDIAFFRIAGGIHVILNNTKEAENMFAKCLNMDQNYTPAYVWLGKLRLIEKKFEEGIYILKKAIEIDPNDYAAKSTLARFYMELGETETAENMLNEAIEINKNFWEAYQTLGFLYFYNNNHEKSIEMFKEVIVLRPNEVEPLLNLAKVYENIGMFEKAISTYKSIIKIEPENFILLCDLAELYIANNEFVMAEETFERALSVNNDSPLAHFRLGLVCRKLKKFDKAIAELKKAINQKTDFVDAYEALYLLYKNDLKNDKEAEYYYKMRQLING